MLMAQFLTVKFPRSFPSGAITFALGALLGPLFRDLGVALARPFAVIFLAERRRRDERHEPREYQFSRLGAATEVAGIGGIERDA